MIQDELETSATETTVQWTMLTPATVKVLGTNKAELTKDGKKLLLQVDKPAGVAIRTWSTEPPHEYDAPNPGTILVGFEVKVPANTRTALTVRLIPEKSANRPTQPVKPLQEWPH
ncbi:hypothetical protein [Spirosoma spitsbergense]|uniref:hypothetical protein n=1 Tax=Spirosoma spitsbergense TaxID=431554 RepID=UPI00035F3A1E|nr:hypothetical protein [Spirosoma spitsbergense]